MNLGILSTLWKIFSPMKGFKNSLSGDGSNLQQRCSSPTPASLETETVITNRFVAYSVLNDQLLHYIMTGKGESEGADAIRDHMDERWYKMSLTQQDAIRIYNETKMANVRRQVESSSHVSG